MKKIFGLLMALVMVFGLSVSAHATLTTIGTATYNSVDYNLISDDDLGIIWLDYSNSPDNWPGQGLWADSLNGAGVLTYNLNPGVTVSWTNDWRLPSTVDGLYAFGYDGTTTVGYNITSSEMGHLFYTELGNTGWFDTSGNETGCSVSPPYCLTKTGDFQNLQANLYWSGTWYSYYPGGAWYFNFSSGYQYAPDKDFLGRYAMAVRPGDVSTSVPEPATMFLLGSGLVGMAVLRKKLGRSDG